MSAVLYQFWRSSASWRVRWALAIKNIPFESVVVDLGSGAQSSAEHLARNPMGRVPALYFDGIYLAESVAIIEYLEETIPEPRLFPRATLERARVRQIIELVNSGIQPLQNTSVYKQHSDNPDEQNTWLKYWNQRGMEGLEPLLQQNPGPYTYGDTFTAADIFLVPQVAAARRFGVDLSVFPRILAAEKSALTEAHAKSALPENQPGAPQPPSERQ